MTTKILGSRRFITAYLGHCDLVGVAWIMEKLNSIEKVLMNLRSADPHGKVSICSAQLELCSQILALNVVWLFHWALGSSEFVMRKSFHCEHVAGCNFVYLSFSWVCRGQFFAFRGKLILWNIPNWDLFAGRLVLHHFSVPILIP